jgi:xylulokinase
MTGSSAGYVVGSDLGTSGCKSIVLDRLGRVCGWSREDYSTFRPKSGWAEQAPQDWYQSYCLSVRRALENAGIDASQVALVAIVGVTHNVVLLDSDNRPLRRSIIYTDNRSHVESEAIGKRWGNEIFRKTFNKIDPLWTWPQLEWVKQHEPDIWKAVYRIVIQKDYVRFLLTGNFATDHIDASGTLLFNPIQLDWIDEFCDDLGISKSSLPEISSPWTIAGHINPGPSKDCGLAEGTPVLVGTTDTAAEVVGAGAVSVGQATVKLATVGRVTVVNPGPIFDPAFLNYPHLFNNLWYPGTVTKYAASAYSWAREALWKDNHTLPEFEKMDRAAASIPAGSGGLLFHPHLDGEFAPHWDPYLRGSFLGVSVVHRRPHFTRAVLEGVGFAIREALEEIKTLGVDFHEIRLIGGGARSDLWAQIMADILNHDILIPLNADAAYGAGLMAGIAADFFPQSPTVLGDMISFRGRLSPQPDTAYLYQELFQIYVTSAECLTHISHQLQKYQ